MMRMRLLIAICALTTGLHAADAVPPIPAGATGYVTVARPAKLKLAKGGALDLPAGTSLVFVGVDEGTGEVRVKFRGSEGTVPATVLSAEKPVAGPAAASAPVPPKGFPADGSVKVLTEADLAKLPPEIRAAVAAAKAEAAHAEPGTVPAGRTVTTTTETPWEKVAPGTPPMEIPAGAKVTKSVTTTRTETKSAPVRTEQRFRSPEEAARFAAAQHARDEAAAQAQAEKLAREEAAKLAPPK
jgi:hypothetical protein